MGSSLMNWRIFFLNIDKFLELPFPRFSFSHSEIVEGNTAKNTVNSPNSMGWKLSGKTVSAKLCLSTIIPHWEIRWNCGVFYSERKCIWSMFYVKNGNAAHIPWSKR